MKTVGFYPSIFVGVILAPTAFSPAAAQESNDGKQGRRLEEVIVTAQKYEQSSADVPMSITAISGDELAAAGISNALDLSFAVPGLSVMESGPGRQLISIRGIASQLGNSSLTGVYLDEMPVSGVQDGFASSYADLRVIDLERIEVLKGPQGTLFGEGAAGGVIRFITRDPDLSRLGGTLSTEFYNTSGGGWSESVTGVANIPLASDVFGIRLAATYEDTSGWIDQPSIGRRNINDSEVKHARVKALYVPAPELHIKVAAEIHRNEGGGSNMVNEGSGNDRHFLQAVDRSASTDFVDEYDMFNLAITYDFGFASLLSSTSYAKFDSVQSYTQVVDADPVPWLEILIRQYPQHASISAQEFRFVSTRNGPFNWTTGANYKDADLRAGSGGPGVEATLFGGALTLTGLGAGGEPITKSKSWAVFGDASYIFFDHLEVGGGLRYFSEERDKFDRAVSPRTTASSEDSVTTFRGYLKYAFSQDANAYFTVANGFRSGGTNLPGLVALGAPAIILPETTLFYELGTKVSLFDERLRLDAAVFFGEYEDMFADRLIQSSVDSTQLVQFTGNGQSAEVKGFEWSIGWAATNSLTLTLSGDVTDTEITKVDPLDPNPVYILGDPISNVPEYGVSVAADYRFQWSGAMTGYFLLSFDRKGKSYATERSNALLLDDGKQVVAPEISFLNASFGGELNGWVWSVFGRNILDEDRVINAATTGYASQARPRSIGVTLSKAF